MITIHKEKKNNEKQKPYFEVVFNYMIGDADGDTTESVIFNTEEELEEFVPMILILNKLKPLEGHWGICFDNYPVDYPGEYIGLTEEEYSKFSDFIEDDDSYDKGIRTYTEYSFLCFEGIDVFYYDEDNKRYNVTVS